MTRLIIAIVTHMTVNYFGSSRAFVKLTYIVLLGMCATVAAQSLPKEALHCKLPNIPPQIPEEAGLDELRHAQANHKAFAKRLSAYRYCLDFAQDENTSPDEKEAIFNAHNYSVDVEERVATLFNNALREYKKNRDSGHAAKSGKPNSRYIQWSTDYRSEKEPVLSSSEVNRIAALKKARACSDKCEKQDSNCYKNAIDNCAALDQLSGTGCFAQMQNEFATCHDKEAECLRSCGLEAKSLGDDLRRRNATIASVNAAAKSMNTPSSTYSQPTQSSNNKNGSVPNGSCIGYNIYPNPPPQSVKSSETCIKFYPSDTGGIVYENTCTYSVNFFPCHDPATGLQTSCSTQIERPEPDIDPRYPRGFILKSGETRRSSFENGGEKTLNIYSCSEPNGIMPAGGEFRGRLNRSICGYVPGYWGIDALCRGCCNDPSHTYD